MNTENAIVAENITKEYRLFTNKTNKLLELIKERNKRTITSALRDITFTVKKGECLGLVGLNGSGKSTLANIMAGIVEPTRGRITVNGDVSCISVSAGLNSALTGLENIEYKGLLLGFERNEIREMTPKIVEFADIGVYINQPVKYYSSGMQARLGFAISINIDPDVLVIDEGLSVGDSSFTSKCNKAMDSYRERGKTIVFVSHSIGTVASFCTKAMWLEFGNMRGIGSAKDICSEYEAFLAKFNSMSATARKEYTQQQVKNEKR